MNANAAKDNVIKYEKFMHDKHIKTELKLKQKAVKYFSPMLKKVLNKIDKESKLGKNKTHFGENDLFFSSRWNYIMRSLIQEELVKRNFNCCTSFYNGLFRRYTGDIYISWE